MKFPFQTWFWINRRILYIEMSFSYIKLFNWENIGYVAYPTEALFWSLKDDKYTHCRWMTSFVYLRNLATSDIPISGFPGWCQRKKFDLAVKRSTFHHHLNKLGRPRVPYASKLSWFWKRFLSLFTIYGHGGHLVQWHETIRTNCLYPMKWDENCSSGFRKEDI